MLVDTCTYVPLFRQLVTTSSTTSTTISIVTVVEQYGLPLFAIEIQHFLDGHSLSALQKLYICP